MTKNDTAGTPGFGRREFIGKLAALSVAGGIGLPSALAREQEGAGDAARGDFAPQDEHLLIRGGYVLSMDERIGTLPRGDVLVRNGVITEISENINAEGVTIIDGSGMIVMPGMIDTHWHVWTSVLRAMAGARAGVGYFSITSSFGKLFTPEDMKRSTLLGLTEAVNSGITFVHDWCHNVRGPDHALASIAAMREAGIRGRFSVGLPAEADQKSASVDLSIIDQLIRNQVIDNERKMISLGLAWPEAGTDAAIRAPELRAARDWGIPVSVHAGRKPKGEDSITRIKDFLGNDMQVIHAVRASAKELKMMARAGVSVSISPFSELRIGYGFPPLPQMLASGVNIGLSVDTYPLSGNADMFSVMKVFMNLANAVSENEFIVSGKRILELATIEGARSLGMDKYIGSLSPGKRADIILIDTKAPNMVPVIDQVLLVVTAAQPGNVDTVIIDGKIRKRGGRLLYNTDELLRGSQALADRLKRQAGW